MTKRTCSLDRCIMAWLARDHRREEVVGCLRACCRPAMAIDASDAGIFHMESMRKPYPPALVVIPRFPGRQPADTSKHQDQYHTDEQISMSHRRRFNNWLLRHCDLRALSTLYSIHRHQWDITHVHGYLLRRNVLKRFPPKQCQACATRATLSRPQERTTIIIAFADLPFADIGVDSMFEWHWICLTSTISDPCSMGMLPALRERNARRDPGLFSLAGRERIVLNGPLKEITCREEYANIHNVLQILYLPLVHTVRSSVIG